MKIRMKIDVGGTFHGLENVHAGDEVNVDDDNGARYCDLGYADPVAEPDKDVETRDETSGPTLADLKDQASALGLPVSGTKAELTERIDQHLAQGG